MVDKYKKLAHEWGKFITFSVVEICSISVNFANAIRSTCSSPSQPPPPEMGGGHFLSDNDAAEVDAVCGGEVDRCDVAKMEHR